MGKRKQTKPEDQTDKSSDQENKGETKPLIVVSDQPKNMPEEKSLKESEKHLTPPPYTNVSETPAHQSWGPANRRKR